MGNTSCYDSTRQTRGARTHTFTRCSLSVSHRWRVCGRSRDVSKWRSRWLLSLLPHPNRSRPTTARVNCDKRDDLLVINQQFKVLSFSPSGAAVTSHCCLTPNRSRPTTTRVNCDKSVMIFLIINQQSKVLSFRPSGATVITAHLLLRARSCRVCDTRAPYSQSCR